MTLQVYGLKNCDTCKKALAALSAADRKVTFIDIRAEADLAAKVPFWLDAVGADALVNKRSTTWRALGDADKAKADGAQATALLVDNPTLIKRPVIERGADVFVGWDKATSAALT